MTDSRLIYGIQAVRQALLSGLVEHVYVQRDLGRQRLGRLDTDIARSGVPVRLSAPEELRQLTGTVKHQGIAALARGRERLSERDARDLVKSLVNPFLLILDGVQDPRNFGALLRTADGAGVDLVVTARSRNVAVTPVVSKVAAGAAEAVRLAEVGNLARFLGHLAGVGVRIVGTDGAAESSIYDMGLDGPIAIVLGGEGQGMRRLTREHCDAVVRLPMRGVVESLNVAVAAGICLYECQRQRGRLADAGAVR